MENLKLLVFFSFILFISSCSNQNKKTKNKSKLKGDFVFENKPFKNDSSKDVKSSEVKDKSGETRDESVELRAKSEQLKAKGGKLDFHNGDKVYVKNKGETLKPKNQRIVNDPVKVPEKWSNAYSNDPTWMRFYDETSNAFLSGWKNEFQRNPETRITKEELLYAYRRRMEKIFFETPSFIEFCVSELGKSEKFETFVSDFMSNVN